MPKAKLKVFIASDHGGFNAKHYVTERLSRDYDIRDLGPNSLNPSDDYPRYAEAVARHVMSHPGSMGILLCRSGEGMEIAANKVPGIRAALAWNEHVAVESRRDNDSNVLSVPADYIEPDDIERMIRVWLQTPFSNAARHARRVEQIARLERESL